MQLAEKIGLILLIAAFAVQCVAPRSRFARVLRRLWVVGIVGIGGVLVSWVYFTYAGWQGSELGRFFLPPHQSPGYFFSYVGERLLAPWGAAFIGSLLAIWFAGRMNRKYGGRFFEEEEPALIGFCFFMSGYPSFLFYLVLMLLAGTGVSAFYQICGWGRAPLYYWWVPVAVFAIILRTYIIPESFLNMFVL